MRARNGGADRTARPGGSAGPRHAGHRIDAAGSGAVRVSGSGTAVGSVVDAIRASRHRHGPLAAGASIGNRRRGPRPLPLAWSLPLTALSGLLLALSFPSPGWWFLAFPALACAFLGAAHQGWKRAAWTGYLGGVAFWVPAISWAGRYLGPVPWLALALFEAAFMALGVVAIALATRWVPRAVPGRLGRVVVLPLVVAALWTGREWFSGNWPYGGFPWGRIGLAMSQGPFTHLAAWTGVLGLTFLVVFLVAFAVAVVLEPGLLRSTRVALPILVAAAVVAVPAWPTSSTGSIRVEAVQGDGPAGYFSGAQPGEVLSSQVEATDTSAKGVDLVVWPEASAEADPRVAPIVEQALDGVVDATGAPIVAGAITQTASGELHNTSFVWTKDGWQGSYDKKRPVPFGEYVPDRWLYSKIAPSLIGLLGRDYSIGTKPNVLSVAGVRAGISICFDIVDDGLTWNAVHGGAQVLLAQTNNADFDGTDENLQQLEIARMRAVESGRSLVNISTVGASQVIGADGRTIDSVPAYTATSMITDVPLSSTTTPAMVISRGLTLVLSLGGLLVLLACAPWGRHSRVGVRSRARRT